MRVPSGRLRAPCTRPSNRRTRAVPHRARTHRGAVRAVERHICRGAVLPVRSCSPCSPCVLFVLPARQRKRMQAQAQAMQESLTIGTPVMTTSGLHGTVAGLGDTTVDLEIAPGVVVTFARQAILEVRKPLGDDADGDDRRRDPRRDRRTPGRRHPLSRATTDGQPLPARRPLLRRLRPDRRPSCTALVFFTGTSRTPQLGLDLRGGTTVTLTARTPDGKAPGPGGPGAGPPDHRAAGQRPRCRRGRGGHRGRLEHRHLRSRGQRRPGP